jgi:hypothetical protein
VGHSASLIRITPRGISLPFGDPEASKSGAVLQASGGRNEQVTAYGANIIK